MKKSFLLAIVSIFLSFNINAQDFTGTWIGILTVSEQKELTIGFDISKEKDGSFLAKMSVKEQGVKGLPMDVCVIEDFKIHMELKQLGIKYDGIFNLKDKTVDGTFFQGARFDLDLKWTEEQKKQEVK